MSQFSKSLEPGVVIHRGNIRYRRVGSEVQFFLDGEWTISAANKVPTHEPSYRQIMDAVGLHWPESVPLPNREFAALHGHLYRWVRAEQHSIFGGGVQRHWLDGSQTDVTWWRHDLLVSTVPGLAEALDFYWPKPVLSKDSAGQSDIHTDVQGHLWRRDGAHIESDDGRSIWRGQSLSKQRRRIVAALCPEWLVKIEPFGEGRWLPAGEGCVRKLGTRTDHARYRRGPFGLDGQVRATKEWRPIAPGESFRRSCGAALNHFWPVCPRFDGATCRPISSSTIMDTAETNQPFDDGEGDTWHRVDADTITDRYQVNSTTIKRRANGFDFSIGTGHKEPLNTNGAWQRRVVEHFWPDFFESKETSMQEKPIVWTFKATPEDIDLPRILREAYDAGAREVTISVPNGGPRTYVHGSVDPLAQRYYNALGNTVVGTGGVYGWLQYSEPVLARAREWQTKESRKIVVKVSGVR